MKLLKDTQNQINNLPILVRWVIYGGLAIGLWKTLPWLLDGCIVVLGVLLFCWCILGLSEDTYNTLISSLNDAKEKIVKDLAASLKEESTP